MTADNFCFYLQNRLIQTSQTGGQWYSDTSPFSIPWLDHLEIRLQWLSWKKNCSTYWGAEYLKLYWHCLSFFLQKCLPFLSTFLEFTSRETWLCHQEINLFILHRDRSIHMECPNMYYQGGTNTNWRGRLSTFDLLFRIACFEAEVNNDINIWTAYQN